MNPNAPLRVACIGGGQLGRMMALEAPRINVSMYFLDPLGVDAPVGAVVPHHRIITGDLKDPEKIKELVALSKADVVTAEIEHIECGILIELEQTLGVNVQPSGSVIQLIQDKYLQKQHFFNSNIPLPEFMATPSVTAIKEAADKFGLPLMLKARTGGYDGRGNAVLKNVDEASIQEALRQLGANADSDSLDIYAEGWIDFDCEIAVMVIRSSNHSSDTSSYPAVNAIQQDSICRVVLAPARNVDSMVREKAQKLAVAAVDSLPDSASGMFGVELFVTKTGDVLLNEIAPRPHNTGHYTQDACVCSQFENHLRGIAGLPLGSTQMIVEAAAMVNVLGAKSETMEDTLRSSNAALSMMHAVVHWYGKQSCRKGRKMGHINIVGHSHAEIENDLHKLLEIEGIPFELLPSAKSTPLVGVVMGSHSDLPTMQAAVEILKEFDVPYEVDIVSAHRTPDKLLAYGRNAANRGLRVIIAGAGGAAHLPGMLASVTALPVIGVPVKTSTLSGVDSLYSIVQMPRGVPVATVAIGNATNAGLLAVRTLSVCRPVLRQKMLEYQLRMKVAVDENSTKLEDLGSEVFLAQMENKNQSVNM
jgi:phosphoribosylaminoimidazole carboxylase